AGLEVERVDPPDGRGQVGLFQDGLDGLLRARLQRGRLVGHGRAGGPEGDGSEAEDEAEDDEVQGGATSRHEDDGAGGARRAGRGQFRGFLGGNQAENGGRGRVYCARSPRLSALLWPALRDPPAAPPPAAPARPPAARARRGWSSAGRTTSSSWGASAPSSWASRSWRSTTRAGS